MINIPKDSSDLTWRLCQSAQLSKSARMIVNSDLKKQVGTPSMLLGQPDLNGRSNGARADDNLRKFS